MPRPWAACLIWLAIDTHTGVRQRFGCQAPVCYRYDGLEEGGRLRYVAPTLTLTSDARHVSLVMYRRSDVRES